MKILELFFMQFILGHFPNVSSITMRTLPTPNLPSIPLEDRKNYVSATGSTHMYIYVCVCVLNSPSSFSLPLWIPVSSYFSLFFSLFPCIFHRDSISVFPCVFRWGPDSLVTCIFSRSCAKVPLPVAPIAYVVHLARHIFDLHFAVPCPTRLDIRVSWDCLLEAL